MEKRIGIITSIDSHMSKIYDLEKKTYINCYLKGKVKVKTTPLVGDYVEYVLLENDEGNIINLLDRKNEVYRPKIANVDQIFVVSSMKEPTLNTYIIDKYLAFLEINHIEPVLVFTKVDLLEDNDPLFKIAEDYQKMNYQVFLLSNKKPETKILEEFQNLMRNKVSLFTGQTGVGKTTTLNNFLSFENQQRTADISQFLNRGKHTTTNIKIYVIEDELFLADSPGFSSFNLKNITDESLRYPFRVFWQFKGTCKFKDCWHLQEHGCAIKLAVEEAMIPKFLYDDYVQMIGEFSNGGKQTWKK